MSVFLECRKVRRTGFFPAFLGGGILAAAIPVLNMAFRAEMYAGLPGEPIQILLDENWQMMAMLNVLLVVAGACLVYHTEYADNAIQKMCALPIRESSLFFGKFAVMAAMSAVVLAIEAVGIAFCTRHWFGVSACEGGALMKNFGYAFLLMFPVILISLFIASVCPNMWVSLGIGVVCVFAATILQTGNFAASLFPFALPFRVFAGAARDVIRNFVIAAVVEIGMVVAVELVFLKLRRVLK